LVLKKHRKKYANWKSYDKAMKNRVLKKNSFFCLEP
jgi:hypothetical protein